MEGCRTEEVRDIPHIMCTEEDVKNRYKTAKTIKGKRGSYEIVFGRKRIPVAVKTMPKNNMRGIVEAKILKSLDHPNIVKLFDFIESTKSIHLVLEYINGDLSDYIFKVDSVPEVEVQHFFKQLACAVKYCHDNEIAHRDIKPENILLDRNKNIKLCDFGLAINVRTSPKSKFFCGTLPYCAPELFSIHISQGYDPRAVDIWSMGVVLYVMVTQDFPFKGDSYDEMEKEMQRPYYIIPPKVPVYIVSVIRKLMTIDPEQRPKIHDVIEYQWLKGTEEFSKPSNIAAMWDHNSTGVQSSPLQHDHEQLLSSLQTRSSSCGPLQHGHEYHLCSTMQMRDIVSCGPALPNHEPFLCSSLETIKTVSNSLSCGPALPNYDLFLCSSLETIKTVSNSLSCGPALPNYDLFLCSSLETIKTVSNSLSCGPALSNYDLFLCSSLETIKTVSNSLSCGPALSNYDLFLCSSLETIKTVSNSVSWGPVQPKQDEHLLSITLQKRRRAPKSVSCGPALPNHEPFLCSSLQTIKRVSNSVSCGPALPNHELFLYSSLETIKTVSNSLSCGPALSNYDLFLCSSLETIKTVSNSVSWGPVQPKQDEHLLSITLQKRRRAPKSVSCGPALPNHEPFLCSSLQTIKRVSNSMSCGPALPNHEPFLCSSLQTIKRVSNSVSCGPVLRDHERFLCSSLQTLKRVFNSVSCGPVQPKQDEHLLSITLQKRSIASKSVSCGPVQHDLEQHLGSVSENHITQAEAQNENPLRSSSFLQHTPSSRSSKEGLENVTATDAHQDKSLTPQETPEPNLTSAQPQRVTRDSPLLWGGWKQVERRIVKGLRRLCCCLPAERRSRTFQRRVAPQEGDDDGVT